MKEDLEFVKSILPNHYQASEDEKHKGSIHCISSITQDGMSGSQWEYFKEIMYRHFGERILEFYHHVNHDHLNFVVYLQK